MPRVMNFYMDDSGTRQPNRRAAVFQQGNPDFFALGGVLIDEASEGEARYLIGEFRARWEIGYPLHSSEIRARSGNFRWLRGDPETTDRFLRDLTRMLLQLPVHGLACVVDRPGYDERYRPTYGRLRWHLCRTAFSIAAERAAKEARRRDAKLRVLVERCSRDADGRLRSYYDEMRVRGCPFDPGTSHPYHPLSAAECRETLYEIRFKEKSSPLIQVADLYLYPIVRGGYDPSYRPYSELRRAARLIDNVLTDSECTECGIKYSCFQLVTGRP